MVERLLDALVLELRERIVEIDKFNKVRGLRNRRDSLRVLSFLPAIGRDALVVDDLDLSGLQLGEHDRNFRNQLDDDAVEFGGAAMVIGVTLDSEMVPADVLDEFEWTGANRSRCVERRGIDVLTVTENVRRDDGRHPTGPEELEG